MKLKTYKRTVETEETNIELPTYFYIQGDGFEEEWIKIEEKKKTTIKTFFNRIEMIIDLSFKDNKGNDFNKVYVVEPYYLNNTCSKEEFEEQLQYVKDQI